MDDAVGDAGPVTFGDAAEQKESFLFAETTYEKSKVYLVSG